MLDVKCSYLLSYVRIRGSVDWGKVWPIIEVVSIYTKGGLFYTMTTAQNRTHQLMYTHALATIPMLILGLVDQRGYYSYRCSETISE